MSSFPLLTIPVAIYNILALMGLLFGPDMKPGGLVHTVLARLPMPAPGSTWIVSVGDLVLLFGLISLFFEIVASSKSGNDTLLNHVLSTFLFIICLVEFLLLPPFATSTFFLLTAMTLLDVLAGFIITTIAARKDIGFGS